MNLQLNYPDTVTFVKVSSDGYGDKSPTQQVDIPVIFVQNTGYSRANYQAQIDSDAICYPDFTASFIVENSNRLEGMYIVADSIYSDAVDDSWFRVESVTVNRDHLLNNQIDNIELRLKKTKPIAGVS